VLFDSTPTPLDLNFQLLGFHVRVTPWHWLTSGLLGASLLAIPAYWLMFILCVFVSVLIHELGHGLSARYFQTPSHIVLSAFGGYAEFYHGRPPRGWRTLIVVLMGPIAGFLFAALLFISQRSIGWMDRHPALNFLGMILLYINIVWGLFNLLPIFPMDGGQAVREILWMARVRDSDRKTYQISIVTVMVVIAMGIFSIMNPTHEWVVWLPFIPSPTMMIWMAFYAVMNYQYLQQSSREDYWTDRDDDNPPWLRRR
jgi:stage IV sporulation protein FB